MNFKNVVRKVALSSMTVVAAASMFMTPAMAADAHSVELPAVQKSGKPSSMVGYAWELPAVQKSGKPLLLPAVQSAREAARR